MVTFKRICNHGLKEGEKLTQRKYDLQSCASRLKILMNQKGLTQQQLADAIGCSRKSISQYCNGKSIPDDVIRIQLADYFNVSVEYLLGQNKYPKVSDEVGDACIKADEELGEEGLNDLAFQVELIRRFCKSFNVEITDFTPKQQKQLDKEIRDFIRFKIEQLRKEK